MWASWEVDGTLRVLQNMPAEGDRVFFTRLKKSQAFQSSFGRSLSQKVFYLGDCFPQAKLESGEGGYGCFLINDN